MRDCWCRPRAYGGTSDACCFDSCRDTVLGGLSRKDAQLSRSLWFLLAQVLSGLEAWRLLVRSEQPGSGANRIAAMQSIKFSPGFDKLEEELRTFEGLV